MDSGVKSAIRKNIFSVLKTAVYTTTKAKGITLKKQFPVHTKYALTNRNKTPIAITALFLKQLNGEIAAKAKVYINENELNVKNEADLITIFEFLDQQ